MFQERFGSASSNRSRIQSAPPTKRISETRSAMVGKLQIRDRARPASGSIGAKPATPDPYDVTRVLEARISSALAGPEIRLSRIPSHEEGREIKKALETQTTRELLVNKQRLLPRRASLRRTENVASKELVPIEDPHELSMLRSIARSQNSSDDPATSRLDRLRRHEYDDDSEEEEPIGVRERRKSLVRQIEQDEPASLSSIRLPHSLFPDGKVSNMEARLSGFRHEKMRSSTRSGDGEAEIVSGLVYDRDFDCYYNPRDDTYYRLNSNDTARRPL